MNFFRSSRIQTKETIPQKEKSELMIELEKVPKGWRYIDSPNYPKIKRLLDEGTPFMRSTEIEKEIKKDARDGPHSVMNPLERARQYLDDTKNPEDQQSNLRKAVFLTLTELTKLDRSFKISQGA
jgi:hypothetical protein